MSETNSLQSLEAATGPTRPPDGAAPKTLDAAGDSLLEMLGVGGMGEVYRYADDALQRDLALKILKAEYHGDAAAEERFLREARLTGSLQHPGIVPIHHLGRFTDGRLCYTMKLVRGRTLADIFRDEAAGPERLPRLLAILEKVCQAMAFAHSKGVIHRDLKPNNIMVGEFGEVQVMDWGLAKELSRAEPAPMPEEATENVETVARVEEADGLSRAGAALGTPSYMPPEQAAGDWDIVDERADVFALGAILCEVLTGRPPYQGANRDERLRRARRADLIEALTLLEKCGADEALTALCRECLAAELVGRPRHAGRVAERVAAYEAAVQERLRRAELERVAAEARAVVETERAREAQARVKAERRAKQRTLALAAAVLILVAVGVAAAWRMQKERDDAQARQDKTDRETLAALQHGRERLDEGWRLHDLAMLREAQAEAVRSADIARGGVSAAVEQQVADFQKGVTERLARAEKNRDLLNALVDIATPHETKTYQAAESGRMMMALAEPSVEDQYAAAFRRRWPDVDMEKQAESVVAARLQEEPETVVQGVIAGLDGWMLEQWRQKRAEATWWHSLGLAERSDHNEPQRPLQAFAGVDSWMVEQWRQKRAEVKGRRLLALVERLDHSEPRRQLRALLIGAVPPRAEDVAELLAGRPPWIALWKLGRGNDWRHLRQLRGRMDVSAEPVLTVLLLAQASSEVGDVAGAEAVLRQALARRPDEVALLDALGKVLERQDPSRLVEAIGCYRAARAKHPGLGVALGRALVQAGRAGRLGPRFLLSGQTLEQASQAVAEGEAILRDLVRQQPKNPEMLIALGYSLYVQEKHVEMEEVYHKFIALNPDDAEAYCNLGMVLNFQGKHAEEEAAYRKAIALKPDDPWTYNNLGYALVQQKKYAEAEVACLKAIALKPDYAIAYRNLFSALLRQGKVAEAEAAWDKFIALKPDEAMAQRYSPGMVLNDAEAYNTLGMVLMRQGKLMDAEAVYRKAIALKPDYAEAYFNLGSVLDGFGGKPVEAEAAYRKAIALNPNYAEAYDSLGFALGSQGKHVEAEAAYRKAIALKPDYAKAYVSLGRFLKNQGKHAEAETAYRKAIALEPDYVQAYIDLGGALRDDGKYAEAESIFHKLIALRPDKGVDASWAYTALGVALHSQGKPAEAEATFRKAIALKPGGLTAASAYCNLGLALNDQGKYAEAEAAYRKANALEPNLAVSYVGLGESRRLQGQFVESLAYYRRGHELGSRRPGWSHPSLQWVQTAERFVELEKKLPAILQGEASPANADEAVTLAQMCQYKKRYVAAARLYADAFTAEPKLADDLNQQHRYNAACSAALAAAGQGEDARLLPDKVVTMFRRWALGWLRDHLTANAKLAEQNNSAENKAIQQRLAHWHRDPDLASVRDAAALDRLAANERAAWQALWRDVDALAKRVANNDKAGEKREKQEDAKSPKKDSHE